MATKKKKPAAKKLFFLKKKVRARPLTWKFYVVTIGIFLVSVASAVVIALYVANSVTTQHTQARVDRINAIYASLNLDSSYIVQNSSIFGEKKVYDWDKSRSYASFVTYIHPETVDATSSELDGKIKAAGFAFIDEPYKGGAYVQYHYKSEQGEYIRLNVSSKPRDDAIQNAFLMNRNEIPDSVYEIDTNAGPSTVVIKVNLDDNNE